MNYIIYSSLSVDPLTTLFPLALPLSLYLWHVFFSESDDVDGNRVKSARNLQKFKTMYKKLEGRFRGLGYYSFWHY